MHIESRTDMVGRRATEAFHTATLREEEDSGSGQLMPFRRLDPDNRPAPFKTYPGAEMLPLPRELRRSSLPAVEVLSGVSGAPQDLDRELLGTLLFLSAGVTRVVHSSDRPVWYRPTMSAGNLRPVEIYVVRDGQVLHYHPLEHALVPLRSDVDSGDGTTLIITGIAFRTCWKYGERGWRHLWWDAGTTLANLLTTADAHGVTARIDTAFPDSRVAALVGVDGVDEAPLALVHLGAGRLRLPDPSEYTAYPPHAHAVAPHALRFPLVVEAQAATALHTTEAVAEWQRTATWMARRAHGVVDSPTAGAAHDRVEDVILRRGSTRFFEHKPVSDELLRWALPAACRAVPWDIAGGTLLEHLVNVHDVAGTVPGAYRYATGTGWREVAGGQEIRPASRHLCVDQSLGGDSSYTVFHSSDLTPVLDQLGGRGYRAAHLEAGVVAGRLALASVALGFGATGLTFYDDQVSRFFGTDATPVLATAVGVPTTPPAPSGTPGAPAVLHGHLRLMTRLGEDLRRTARRDNGQ